MQRVLRKVREGGDMKSTAPTYRKYSSVGVDWASWFLGIGLGLTLALQVTTMRRSDISSVYAVVASFSRLAALTGTFFAVVGIFLIARIPWVERGVGHDRLVTWHRKLGPWSLYLIGIHITRFHSLCSRRYRTSCSGAVVVAHRSCRYLQSGASWFALSRFQSYSRTLTSHSSDKCRHWQ